MIDHEFVNSFSSVPVTPSEPQYINFSVGTRSSFCHDFHRFRPGDTNGEHKDFEPQTWGSFDSEDIDQRSSSLRRNGFATMVSTGGEMTWSPEGRDEPMPKKPVRSRAQQACENCRLKKSKCDEKSPQCTNCWEATIECVYKGSTKAGKKGQVIGDLHERINHCCTMLELIINEPQLLLQRLGDILSFNNAQSGVVSPFTESLATASSYLGGQVDPTDVDALQGTLSIPFQHSTSAHKLVDNWKWIRSFYDNIPESNYVVDREWSREPLASYTSASMDFAVFSDFKVVSPDAQLSGEIDRNVHAHYSESCLALGCSPRASGIGNDAKELLRLESQRARSLWHSFLRNIFILHPFLDTQRFSRLMKRFEFSQLLADPSSPTISNVQQSGVSIRTLSKSACPIVGDKRKRTEESTCDVDPNYVLLKQKTTQYAEKVIDTAIILLVFALGDICQAENILSMKFSGFNYPPMPSFKSQDSPIRYSTFQKAGLYVSESMKDSGPLPSLVSTCDTSESFISVQNTSSGVPGLNYYIAALRILGEHSGNINLSFIHAKLLAGLYASQLLRPKEAMDSIRSAGTSLQIILDWNKPSIFLDSRGAEFNSIRITYYTCLLLESDLLAELNFPPSGISRYEDQVAPPGEPVDVADDLLDCSIRISSIMTYFAQQIHLRKILNRVHTALYSSEANPAPKSSWRILSADELLNSLEDWKSSLFAKSMRDYRWDDSDLAATEINAARMRAKYYGGKVIINRPFLHRALATLDEQSQNPSFTSDVARGSFSESEFSNTTRLRSLDSETELGAARCIAALIQSTKAFDRLSTMPKRLIVTNLFGTAQAQFGNILVLAAVVKSGYFPSLISPEEFNRLLRRTIVFIRNLAPMSDTMEMHLQVLSNIQNNVIFDS